MACKPPKTNHLVSGVLLQVHWIDFHKIFWRFSTGNDWLTFEKDVARNHSRNPPGTGMSKFWYFAKEIPWNVWEKIPEFLKCHEN